MAVPSTLAQLCTEFLAQKCAYLTELSGVELLPEQLEVILAGAQATDLRRLARCNGFPTVAAKEEDGIEGDDTGPVSSFITMKESDESKKVPQNGNGYVGALSASMRNAVGLALERRWRQLYFARLRDGDITANLASRDPEPLNGALPPGTLSWSAAYAHQEREKWRQMKLACARLRQRRAQTEQERASKRIRSLPIAAVASVHAALIERQSERFSGADQVTCGPKVETEGVNARKRLIARFRYRSSLFRRLHS
jgi:hypothetical protein